VPFTRARPWPGALARLHDAGWTTVALAPSGDELLDDVSVAVPDRVAVLVGAEGPGLAPEVLRAAHHRVRIPVAPGVDSLNVAAAAAIALYALRR
jgi:tRNA G18 (ribose-2'-O)-methylase SpoU